MNRPDKLNAYTAQMGVELADAIVQTDEDDAIRAVIQIGEGFGADADISAGAGSFDTSEGDAIAGDFGGGETRRLRGAGAHK